jgi:hypothetical protein
VDPELSIERAIQNYRRLGYSENWINQRIKSIEVRKSLTDEWDKSGVQQGQEYAALTDLMSKTWSGLTTREYPGSSEQFPRGRRIPNGGGLPRCKCSQYRPVLLRFAPCIPSPIRARQLAGNCSELPQHKGLKKDNLRDIMTTVELVLNMLAEVSATDISIQRNPKGLAQSAAVAQEGAEVAADARQSLEKRIGRSAISRLNAADLGMRQIEGAGKKKKAKP